MTPPEICYTQADKLHIAINFTPPVISAKVSPMQGQMPTIISLPYGRCPPLHFQAPSWRHLLKLMARLSGTKMEPTIEAMAVNKNEVLKLRSVIQFIKVCPPSFHKVSILLIFCSPTICPTSGEPFFGSRSTTLFHPTYQTPTNIILLTSMFYPGHILSQASLQCLEMLPTPSSQRPTQFQQLPLFRTLLFQSRFLTSPCISKQLSTTRDNKANLVLCVN